MGCLYTPVRLWDRRLLKRMPFQKNGKRLFLLCAKPAGRSLDFTDVLSFVGHTFATFGVHTVACWRVCTNDADSGQCSLRGLWIL